MDNTEIVSPLILQRAFPGMKESEAREMIDRGVVHEYPSEVILCHEGSLENTFYVILEGRVRVTKVINNEEERLLKFLNPGDFFGEMAILHKAPRAATVATVMATITLEISPEAFADLLEKSSSLSLAIAREVSRRLRENDEMAIEDLRTKARELASAYQQLAELEFARGEFLTTIAHELRTPLMAASGFLQVIQSGALQGQALSTALETVSRNLQEIVALTNDILFLQEMDLILPRFLPTDIGAVIAAVVDKQRKNAERGRIAVHLNISQGMPPIMGDTKSLERAFNAILDNAIKFSPDGGEVLIEVTCQDLYMLVKVQDHGVGIPPEALPRIFERFFHLDSVNGHLFRGVGLGLPIARQVIEQHGGGIEVNTELGVGTTFTIRLKLG